MEQLNLNINSTTDKIIDVIKRINANGNLATVSDLYEKIPEAPKPSIRRAVNELTKPSYQKIVAKISEEESGNANHGNEKYGYVVNHQVEVKYRGLSYL